mmetsp:Transcript_4554/g.10562  ORF Transcript_4554/g.10562 Transcript_4554/m.10562 type:complete len:96 (-) Transcript_4554:148-435(-)
MAPFRSPSISFLSPIPLSCDAAPASRSASAPRANSTATASPTTPLIRTGIATASLPPALDRLPPALSRSLVGVGVRVTEGGGGGVAAVKGQQDPP